MPGPLDGTLRLLDLSERSPAAAIAGMVLADLGAEVIRVEPEGGDPVRTLAGSRVWLRGQMSVTVGPDQVKNGQWQALRASADVILTTAQPWTSKPIGLLDGYPHDPQQILSVLTAYPRTTEEVKGPRHGADYPVCGELIEAQYGLPHFQEGWRPKPIFLGWPHATYGAAWLLQLGILGALFERSRTGRGQVLTTSLFDGVAILSNQRWVGGKNIGPELMTTSRLTSRHNRRRIVLGLLECGDGIWVQVHTGPRGAFGRMMKVIGREDLMNEKLDADPHSIALTLDPAAADDLWAFLDKTFKTRPSEYWCEVLNKVDVCCMPALPPGDALWLKQIEDNGLVDIAPDGQRQLGKLVKYARTPITVSRDIPLPGQHNAILLAQGSGHTQNGGQLGNGELSPPPAANARRVGPLDGVLVLDFGIFMAGPFANRIFSDLGARVIKVEEYGGDPMRGPILGILLGVQRGKESIAVNLKSPQGRDVIYELVKRADVIHNNMRDGAMDRLGMGYETLRTINPRLIYCHSSGYGNEGAWSKLPTFEPLHSAITGMLSRTGGEGNPPDYYLSHMDFGCGLTSATMVLAALIERERSGEGQYLEVPQIGAGLLAMSDVHGHKDRRSETFPLDHEQRGHAPTNAMYRTSDGWIVIACYSGVEWDGVWRALGIELAGWLGYERARQERLSESTIARTIEAAISRLTTADAERRLRAEGVPCTAPQPFTVAQLMVEPGLRTRGVIVAERHAQAGEVYEVGHTIRFGNATAMKLEPAPVTGQHSVAILREIGRSETEIDMLIANKVVNAADRQPATAAAEAEKHP
jgi:crotonobetainyl-CoA:carnitine CoA-transferase CaiB-like acyl-CoA transferase